MTRMGKLRFAVQIAQSNFRRLRKPYKLLFALTYRCNARCLTCNIWKRKPTSELNTEEIQRFFAKNNHFHWVNLTGGEILLRSDLPEILRTIHSECKGLCLLNFATNGLQPSRTERILAEMPTHAVARTIVTVSVDGPPRLNDRIRGVKGDFRKSVETFRRLKALQRRDLEVYFGITLSDYNAGKLKQTFHALKEEIGSLRYQDIHINIAHSSPHYYFNEEQGELATKEEIMRDMEEHYAKQPRITLDAVRFLEKRYVYHLHQYLMTKKRSLQCRALSASCFIDPQGTVYPCVMYNKPLGNLRDVDFNLDRIWNKQETVALQQDIVKDRCPVDCGLACELYQSILGRLLR